MMSVAVHANSDCLKTQSSQPDTPTADYDVDEYSDGGCPTLPRPKVIVAVSRSGSPWSAHEASLLQTVPVRLSPQINTRARTTSPVSASRVVDGKTANFTGKESASCSVNKVYCNSELHINTESVNSPGNRSETRPTGTLPMNSDARTKSATPPKPTVSVPQPKAKKTRLPKRAVSFSFGDKKRRTINLFGTARRGSRDDSILGVARSGIAAPSSPLLLGRTKFRNVPFSLGTFKNGADSVQQECIVEECDSSSDTAGTPVLENTNGTATKSHHWLSPDLEESFTSQSRSTTNKHPSLPSLNSPTSTHRPFAKPSVSSTSSGDVAFFQGSIESLPLHVEDTPPTSASQSPTLLRTLKLKNMPLSTSTGCLPHSSSPLERKLSDPFSSTPETSPQLSEKGTRGTKIRKGYTFCVSQTRSRESPVWKEMRHHVVRFLLETEQSYVQSLKTIIKVYFDPLKRPQGAFFADPSLVKDIFYQIPEICNLHEKFLHQLNQRVEHWHPLQRIGDIFVDTFSKCQLMDIYSKFIGNFMRAKAAMELAKQGRPVFAKFLEQRARDSRGKLSLDDLLIKPVQRIPRYVLFIKDLLKHTAPSHPDHSPLQQALGELTMLAERVNASERERGRIDQQKELLVAVDGLALVLKSESRLVRYDMITEIKGNVQKRDRFLILYSDVIVCASARRKSTGFKRSSLLNLNALPEAMRYKIKWHIPLTDLSLVCSQAPLCEKRRQNTLEKMIENMKKDENTLQQILELTNGLQRPHQPLVSILREMTNEVKEEAVKKREELENLPREVVRIDLISYSTTPPLQYSLLFPSQRIRNSWEMDFLATKQAANNQALPSTPVAPPTSPPPILENISPHLQFLHPILVQSGRVGIELTCATVGLPVDCDSSSCLWVCCSDGYGGQVCLLDLQPSTQPHLVTNITISDSKILCIAAVPLSTRDDTPLGEVTAEIVTRSTSCTIMKEEGEEEEEMDSTDSSISDTSSELSHTSVSRTGSSASEYKCSREETLLAKEEGSSSPLLSGRLRSKHEDKEEKEEEDGGDEDIFHSVSEPIESPESGLDCVNDTTSTTNSSRAARGNEQGVVLPFERQSRTVAPTQLPKGVLRRVRSNSAPPDPERPLTSRSHPSALNDSHQNATSSITRKIWAPLTLRPGSMTDTSVGRSMWLGTEAGNLYVYSTGNNLRSRSNRQTVDLPAAVHCIRCFEDHVYVGLGNGSLAVFDTQDPASSGPRHCIAVGSEPVLCCVPVMGDLWVSCGGTLYLVERKEKTTKPLATLPSGQQVHNMVVEDSGVWVSVGDAPIVHLYHAPSATLMTTVDCTRAVVDLLRGYDPIIRQHKSSNLKITALLSTPTSLLIGTSAGAVLALPQVPASPEPYPLLYPPRPVPLSLGHVDPVHFLSSIQREGETLVLSGGNGYENFVSTTTLGEIPETASCLLIWKS